MVAPGAVRVIVHLATHSSVSSWKVSMKWRLPLGAGDGIELALSAWDVGVPGCC